ncbi:MAG: hypothetical protein GC166_09485 [Alphaproteobacteria bacterium]|nr:hypothetical protein [Alphaproteobacteria bacterium]
MRRFIGLVAVLGMILMVQEAQAEPFAKPDLIRFGASTADMQAALQGKCAKSVLRDIVPPFLPRVKDRQVQIDCDGFPFMGKPRWAEFVIGDDRLQMVWIMTDKSEEATLYAAMVEAYGAPTHRNAQYDAFTQVRAALRKDRAEILFYAAELDGDMPEFSEP